MAVNIKKILVAPLDWGLGHTTRCVPVIRHLLELGCTVFVAAEGFPAAFIQHRFPGITVIPLKGYRIHYGSGRAMGAIVKQVPKIIGRIRKEHAWLRKMQQQYHFDAVISDNRYGLFLPGLPTVIMTHQLQVQTGKGHWADRIIRYFHYRKLEKFSEIWVVDQAAFPGLSGTLAHPSHLPRHTVYMGGLSQFERPDNTHENAQDYILMLLSGPEPLRTLLEQKMMEQVKYLPQYQFVLVSGTGKSRVPLLPNVRHYDYLGGQPLAEMIRKAQFVICRSGYSTLMDLVLLQKIALLIPTPGQSEQVYLAAHFKKAFGFGLRTQATLSLAEDIPFMQQQTEKEIAWPSEVNGFFKPVINKFVGKLR